MLETMGRSVGDGQSEASTEKLSYREFLAWVNEDTLAEWVDGEVIMTSPASARHQLVVGFLERILGIFLAALSVQLILNGLAEAGAITLSNGH